jgi:hypothetical protein
MGAACTIRQIEIERQGLSPQNSLILVFALDKRLAAKYPRKLQHNSNVIPGKLAIASATRNPGISKISGCRFSPA